MFKLLLIFGLGFKKLVSLFFIFIGGLGLYICYRDYSSFGIDGMWFALFA